MPEAGVGAPAPGGVLPSHGEIPPAEYVANLGMSVPLTRMVDAIVHKELVLYFEIYFWVDKTRLEHLS